MQTNFNVSNTDVITMLIVKQKAFLEEKFEKVREEWINKIGILEKEIWIEYDKHIAKFPTNILRAYETIINYENPGKSIKFKIAKPNLHLSELKSSLYEYKVSHVNLEIDTEGMDEDEATDFEDNLSYPFEIYNGDWNVSFKIKFTIPIDPSIMTLRDELDGIKNLLSSSNIEKMKENIIAKVTEQAIKDIPALQTIVFDTTKLLTA